MVKLREGPRNKGVAPYLQREGTLEKPLKIPPELIKKGEEWSVGLSPFDRCHYHQTLASVRRYWHFKPVPGLIQETAVDLALDSKYDHGADAFADKIDTKITNHTMGIDTRAKTRNTKDIILAEDPVSAAVQEALEQEDPEKPTSFKGSCFGSGLGFAWATTKGEKKKKAHVKYNDYHLVHVGGITQKKHPSNVKLMNSSHHSPQTNAGYSRQDSDGNAYQY